MTEPTINPDYIGLVTDRQSDFLYLLNYLYERNAYFNFSKEETFEKLYLENSVAYKILDISYEEFVHFVKLGYFKPPSGLSSLRVWRRDYDRRHSGHSYCKKAAHQKKSKELTTKEAWRIHKGIKRDKIKRLRRKSAGKWYKRYAAKQLRKYFRMILVNETKWDDMIKGSDLKKFPAYDPWMWD